MRIAHLAAEVAPFAKTGGLGDVVGSLPIAQADLGHEVTVWMPLYRQVWQELNRTGVRPELACDPIRIELGFQTHEIGVLRTRLPGSDVPLYLIGSDPHFDREQIYGAAYWGDDGLIRYSIFVRTALEAMKRLWLAPNIIHAHDWHAALAPMALAWDRPRDWVFDQTRAILTIHNLAYQGIYPPSSFVHLGLPIDAYPMVEWDGNINLMKGGIASAAAITAVSPTFAREITTPDGGFGLDAMLRSRRQQLVGIVNGIDPNVWNPATDSKIPFNYNLESLELKRKNREELLRLAGMNPGDGGLVVGIVGRLTSQKGLDMLFPVLPNLLNKGVRFVMLGSGESKLEGLMHEYSQAAPGKFWGYVGFQDDLAHSIEAGADAFLMPSRFEPCGLNQLYSLAYGTPPIVRRVGGLADTVIGYDGHNASWATGFNFDSPQPSALRDSVLWAQHCYENSSLWTRLAVNGMHQDFSWHRSAQDYQDVYSRALYGHWY